MSTVTSSYEQPSLMSSSTQSSSQHSSFNSSKKRKKKKMKKVYAEFGKEQNGFVIPTDLWTIARNSILRRQPPKLENHHIRDGCIVEVHKLEEEEKKSDNPLLPPQQQESSSSTYEDGIDETHDVDDDCEDDEKDMKMIVDYMFEHHVEDMKKSIKIQTSRGKLEYEKTNRKLLLLDKISQVQRQYLVKEKPAIVFGGLLDCLLDLMDSEYGFIGEVKYDEHGDMYLFTHATTNIAWNAATRKFYDDNITADGGLSFRNMNSLFGTVLTTQQTVIANDPKNHPKAAGIPEGHPPLNHFLGIPFFVQNGTVLNGMVGIANKRGGYSAEDVAFLEPLVVTCSNLIQAYNTHRENEFLINKLEDLVVLRTNELELANQKLVEQAKMQMEHFACMSHEIRTPLNCVIGLTSLLQQETNFTPFQQDSLSMIIKSGELLMAVVNDVLDYSKLQTENMTMEIHETSLQDTLDAVVHSIANKASDKNVTLSTRYDCQVPTTLATDSRRLQQILYNLLGNAIKFSKESSSVELNVSVIHRSTSVDHPDENIETGNDNHLVKPKTNPNNGQDDDMNTNNVIPAHPNRPQDLVGGKTVGSMIMTDERRKKLLSVGTYQSVSSLYHSINSTKMDCSSVDAEEDYSFHDDNAHGGDSAGVGNEASRYDDTSNDFDEEVDKDDSNSVTSEIKKLELKISHHTRLIQMSDHDKGGQDVDDNTTTIGGSINEIDDVIISQVPNYKAKNNSANKVTSTDVSSKDSVTGQISLSSQNQNELINDDTDKREENNTTNIRGSKILSQDDSANHITDHNLMLTPSTKKEVLVPAPSLSLSSMPDLDQSTVNIVEKIVRNDSSSITFHCSPSHHYSSKNTISLNDHLRPHRETVDNNVEQNNNNNNNNNNNKVGNIHHGNAETEKQEEKSVTTNADVAGVSRCPFMKTKTASSSLPSVAPLSEETENSSEHLVPSVDPSNAASEAATISRCPFMKTSSIPNTSNEVAIVVDSNEQRDQTRQQQQNEAEANEVNTNEVTEIDQKTRNIELIKNDDDAMIQPPQYIGDDIGTESKHILRFVVKDYGKGIAKEDFYKIFQPFQQAKSGKNSVHEGTGLGLAITSRLVNGLGGSVTVDSELGQWTQFTLDLPIIGDYDVNHLSPIVEKLHQHMARILVVTNDFETSTVEEFAIQHNFEFHKYKNFESLLLIHGNPSNNKKNNFTTVCIIHEDLYNATIFDTLANSLQNVILMTFGPNYSVKESKKHYRSICRTIPSVMMNSILRCIEDNIEQKNMEQKQKINSVPNSPHPSHGHHPPLGIGSITLSNEMKPPIVIDYTHLRVLIAEDNIINQKVLSQMLRRLGIKDVDLVDNGLKAVQASEKKDYDVLLLDMQMPVMGGLEASRIIVDRFQAMISKKPKPHIAFVTAHASTEYESLAKAAGGDDFITKPFSLQMIRTFFESLNLDVLL